MQQNACMHTYIYVNKGTVKKKVVLKISLNEKEKEKDWIIPAVKFYCSLRDISLNTQYEGLRTNVSGRLHMAFEDIFFPLFFIIKFSYMVSDGCVGMSFYNGSLPQGVHKQE